jgi:hypothetical protein
VAPNDWLRLGGTLPRGAFLLTALGDLVSKEIRGWLDLAPRAILRLAAARLDPELRKAMYEEEWLPELVYVLRGAESRPITRLIRGTNLALGLLLVARRIARYRAHAATAAAGVDWARAKRISLTVSLPGGREVKVPASSSQMNQMFFSYEDMMTALAGIGYDWDTDEPFEIVAVNVEA